MLYTRRCDLMDSLSRLDTAKRCMSIHVRAIFKFSVYISIVNATAPEIHIARARGQLIVALTIGKRRDCRRMYGARASHKVGLILSRLTREQRAAGKKRNYKLTQHTAGLYYSTCNWVTERAVSVENFALWPCSKVAAAREFDLIIARA